MKGALLCPSQCVESFICRLEHSRHSVCHGHLGRSLIPGGALVCVAEAEKETICSHHEVFLCASERRGILLQEFRRTEDAPGLRIERQDCPVWPAGIVCASQKTFPI